MEWTQLYHILFYFILLYFSDDDIPVVTEIIDVDVVSIIDDKVIVDDDITVDVGVQMIPIL